MKKILLTLFVGLIGLINFGYCSYECTPIKAGSVTFSNQRNGSVEWFGETNKFCVTSNQGNIDVNFGSNTYNLDPNEGYCIYKTDYPNGVGNFPIICKSSTCTFGYVYAGGNCLQMTSLECQTEYGLVDPSNIQTEIRVLENNNETTTYYLGYGKYATIDLNGNDYLQYPLNGNYTFVINSNSNNNGNCTGTINTGDIQWSALYINQIQHQSAPTINISIPDEFDWNYTVDSESFDLDVNGYNVDTEYIDGIIRTQNYKPTSEDFTQLVGMLAPYSKYLLFLLFIFIIWAWIKKPFKSKKL